MVLSLRRIATCQRSEQVDSPYRAERQESGRVMSPHSYTDELECPYCDGSGDIPVTVMECCGMPALDGSCCGMGKVAARLEQCEWCANRPKPPATSGLPQEK